MLESSFLTIPEKDMLLEKLSGKGPEQPFPATIHVDMALNALKASLSLSDVIECAQMQVERDVLKRVLATIGRTVL